MTLTRAYLRAWRYFRDDRGKILFSLLLVGLSTLASLAQPFPLAILFDRVLSRPASNQQVPLPHRLFAAVAPQNVVGQIILLAAAMLVLRLISELLGLWQGFYKIRIGYNGLLRVRCDLFRKLQQLSLGFHKSQAQGDLIYRISSDSNGFISAFNVVNAVVVNVVTLVLMACIMFSMNWKLTLLSISIAPILFWAIRKYGTVLTDSSVRATKIEADLATTVHRSVANIGLVQAFGREDDEYSRFTSDVGRGSDAWVRMHMHGMVYWLILGVAFGLGASIIFAYGGYLAYRGALKIGFLWVFFQYVTTQLYGPLHRLSSSETELRRGLAGMLRVYEVLDREPTIKDAPDAIALPRQPRVLHLDHVSFAYNSDAPVLRDLNVTIRPGEMVAFVGPSGAGKTSLLNLLPRFYDPTSGSLRLDEHDVRQVKVRDVRRHIALVLQDNPILSASVAENIAYGNPDASDTLIRQAARLAGAESFIESMPQKYKTQIHEAGQNLSGGQRQRIAIARALATEAPILVLDEPTSALDSHNEQMITQTLADLKRKRTIILVSHRLSTVLESDRIYLMEGGQIVEQGTHHELISRGGAYFRMASHQMKIAEPAAVRAAREPSVIEPA